MVVNNCAAALLLAMASLAKGKQVVVSRGELIEIGGEFHPHILAASGARLAEVGTTNRTRIGDYKGAVGDRTGLDPKAGPSVELPARRVHLVAERERARAARAVLPVLFLFDVGSGLLHHGHGHPADEPSVTDALAQGADLVTFSGRQAARRPQGIVVGRAELLAKLRRHPIARPSGSGDADGRARAGVGADRGRARGGAAGVQDAPRLARRRPGARAAAVRDDRGRAGGARVVVLVRRRRRVDAGDRSPVVGRARRGARPASVRGAFGPGRRRRSPGWTSGSCCSTAGPSRTTRSRTARAVHYALEGDEDHGHDLHGDEDEEIDEHFEAPPPPTRR